MSRILVLARKSSSLITNVVTELPSDVGNVWNNLNDPGRSEENEEKTKTYHVCLNITRLQTVQVEVLNLV